MYYWYYYANKAKEGGGVLIGAISFALLVFCGILMHSFAVTSIMPNDWMGMYASGGNIDMSGWTFNVEIIRLAFMVSLALPVVGIFLQAYGKFVGTRSDMKGQYADFTASLGTKLATVGLLISAVLFVLWMLAIGYLFHPISLASIVGTVILLALAKLNKNAYITVGWLVVVALLFSTVREWIRYDIMAELGYTIYDYPVNLEIPTILMFLSTFLVMGGVGVAYLLTMAWKVGKSEGLFDGSKDAAVAKLGDYTLWIMSAWLVIFFGWGLFTLFSNIL